MITMPGGVRFGQRPVVLEQLDRIAKPLPAFLEYSAMIAQSGLRWRSCAIPPNAGASIPQHRS
jgi:hypothetical protein